MRFAIAFLAGTFLLATTAEAADKAAKKAKKGKQDAEAIFKKLDTNNDSKVSKEEFAKYADLQKKGAEGRQDRQALRQARRQ